ncbi:MAG TPA: TIGR04255 family protein [Flavobacteriales bacterium]|nr:TIGR04255 family protein [Flavobacteriales bacterium]
MNMVSEPLPPAQPGRYKKPPVVEMIFSIRTASPNPVDPEVFLEAVPKEFTNTFSEHKLMHTFQSQVMMKADGTADHDTKSQLMGYRFVAPDSSFLAHYLVNGLTLNFLPPYSGYAPSLEVFKKHWDFYKRLTNAPPVACLVLRYIDRIDIPRDGDALPLSAYFNIAPSTLGLKAHNCYVQYNLNDDAQDIRARVIWSSLENKPEHWSFALDTEATLETASAADEGTIWTEFGRLHDWCTHVFNESLTAKCKQLFQ